MKKTIPSLLTKFDLYEINNLFKVGKTIFSSSEMHILSAKSEKEYGRLLLIIPKRIGTAPDRNILRRRLKAIFYQQKLFMHKRDLVFIAKSKTINKLPFFALQAIFLKLFAV